MMRAFTKLIGVALLATGLLFAQGGDGYKSLTALAKHNLSAAQGSTGTVACEYCHAPHKLSSSLDVTLLWNLPLKSTTYNVYGGSSTLDSQPRNPSAASSSTRNGAYMSLLCLSCHDGAITVASAYNPSHLGATTQSLAGPNIGSNFGSLGLADDHPVDFVWTAALATADTGTQPPGGTAAKPTLGKTTALPLFNDTANTNATMQCATCHNPHDNTNGDFLRMGNSGSALCLNCHGN